MVVIRDGLRYYAARTGLIWTWAPVLAAPFATENEARDLIGFWDAELAARVEICTSAPTRVSYAVMP